MEEEIKAAFAKNNFSIDDEERVLQKCVTFCINFKLSPSDLVSSWEVYFLNRQWNEPKVQDAQMEGFLLHLQNEQKEAAIKEEMHLHMYSSNDVDMILNDEYEDKDGILGTPANKSENLISEENGSTARANGYSVSVEKHSSLVTPFGTRRNKFVVQYSLNDKPNRGDMEKEHDPEDLEEDIIRRVKPSTRCSLQIHRSQPEPGCRFMYDRIEDKFNYLESRIKMYGTALVNSRLYEDPADPSVASQVVGIEGHNPSGHCLIASKLVDSIPLSISADLDLHPAKKQTMDPEFQPTDSSPVPAELSITAAAGPFTTTDNLMFEPLMELLSYARRKPPQLLVLLGPFIDSEHPEIKKGSVDRSFDDIFHLEILRRLQDYVEYMGPSTHVVLVPSVRDANHDFVFPQPAFDLHSLDLKPQIISLTNPAFFGANEVKVGCCSIDILKQLSGEEFSRRPTDVTASDRMSRLASHIISQRSFYPLYPPSEEVPMDFSLAPEAVQIPSIPEILILPSDLAPFVKVLSLGQRSEGEEQVKCICVNPGRLAKGVGGGNFAEISYCGTPDATSASIIRI
ncbi:DNA polymerase alpha, subunit B, N-terminal [Dillenia turbinata]|uniref:DNA polymerase alpha subunit B n=1 Tax=Dillenia turbinata TaxID=194707 RepID=A0AAN8VCD3_9MAGN